MTIRVAHDFTCPWCWIGYSQSLRLAEEFGVNFDWIGFELWPEGLEHVREVKAPEPPEKPRTPGRLELAYLASNAPKPRTTPPTDDIHNALEAVEHAKTVGVAEALVHRLYQAQWMEGKTINDLPVLAELAAGIVPDTAAMLKDVEARKFADLIVPFDECAHAAGVWNVPTFFIGDKTYAEQPYLVLQRAVKALVQ